MNLREFKERVDKMCELYARDIDNIKVVVHVSNPSMGSRAYSEVKSIHRGFDWERNQARIETEDGLWRITENGED